jgi:hypothetical protein
MLRFRRSFDTCAPRTGDGMKPCSQVGWVWDAVEGAVVGGLLATWRGHPVLYILV